MAVEVLQLMPLIASGDAALHGRYDVCRWYEVADPEAWLAANGSAIRAVVTAGHLGITDAMMDKLPNLGIVAIAGVGFERVNLPKARDRGIRVTNTPDVLTEDVADMAVGLMIAAMRRIPDADRHVRAGQWPKGELPLATKVWGRRYGIFGLGQIGEAVARRLSGFGGTVAYTSRAEKPVPYTYHPTLLALAEASDVLVVTAAASPATRHAVNREILEALGPSGYLVNVARGSLVDEEALVTALRDGRLGGAGIDVYADEPNVPADLAALPNTALSPHVGSATTDAREAMATLMLRNLDAFTAGHPLPTPVV